ncbi:MAG: TRAP transporter substrate-binding protein [Hydrogenophaga sp.]|uniref:TRAP transporter substrate-binding protein n=1 Tax=Hydrogenophaga sp. TaxID=1904254 RepID=UPI00271BF62E|nr:TRAP transporter substrate-binding protein [Hydrogenophaga sp.]MDO9570598.1 TRAP transporter substrate-binding protein [Hydrogenophaga sp.]MDP3376298.1 TRAP transporter substrate-binding protein [Hydrogenophaga sp.]
MIQRRTFLQSGVATALGAPALTGYAQQQVKLRFHTFMPQQSNGWQNIVLPWMNAVEKDSAGAIKFEAYPAMQMGGTPAQLYDQARDGVVDVVWTLPGNTPGRFPRIEVFELPFMMNNAESTSRACWDYVQAVAKDEFRDVHALAFHVHSPGVIHMKDKLVKRPEDFAGAKIRGATRQVSKLLSNLGAAPVGMPLPAIPDALSKGVINGAVIPWDAAYPVKAHELAHFHSEFDPSVNALYTAGFVLAMNKNKYNNLSPELKKIIDKNSGIELSGRMGAGTLLGDPVGRKAAQERGNTIHIIKGADAQEFRRKSAAVEVEWMQEMNKRGIDGKALVSTARQLIDKHAKKA